MAMLLQCGSFQAPTINHLQKCRAYIQSLPLGRPKVAKWRYNISSIISLYTNAHIKPNLGSPKTARPLAFVSKIAFLTGFCIGPAYVRSTPDIENVADVEQSKHYEAFIITNSRLAESERFYTSGSSHGASCTCPSPSPGPPCSWTMNLARKCFRYVCLRWWIILNIKAVAHRYIYMSEKARNQCGATTENETLSWKDHQSILLSAVYWKKLRVNISTRNSWANKTTMALFLLWRSSQNAR